MVKRTDRRPRSRRTRVRRRLWVESLGDRRVLASISGAVFEDLNFSFDQDPGEPNLPHRLVYVDSNANAKLDVGESFVVAEPDGTFVFDNLADGDYLLRLFNGTQTQTQTSPIEAVVQGEQVAVNGAQFLLAENGAGFVLTAQGVVLADLETGIGETIELVGENSELSKMQVLPDGSLLVIGSSVNGETAWIVDPETKSSAPINLAQSSSHLPWSDLAVDGSGQGLIVEHQTELAARLHAIDASNPAQGIAVTPGIEVPAASQVIASSTGPRSVLGKPHSGGLELSLWSNPTGSQIPSATAVVAANRLLEFDDAAGLLVARTQGGGVGVYDANQGFASLHEFTDLAGPVTIDSARDLLLAVSPIDAMLRMFDLRDGTLIAGLAVDLSSIGGAVSVTVGDTPDTIVVMGAVGVAEVGLNRPAANRVSIQGGQDVDTVLFGVSIEGANSAPAYVTLPELSTPEDVGFDKPAPTALEGQPGEVGAIDSQGDEFVLIQRGPAAHGTAEISIDGAISYQPDNNFFGVDTVPVVLHDGETISPRILLEIEVTPTPDPPEDIGPDDAPLPEDAPIGTPVTDIEIIDPDSNDNHIIVIEDGRFEVINGQIIFVRGQLDFEGEPLIPLDVIVTDPETGTVIQHVVTIRISDVNDPITAITPNTGSVAENTPGDSAVVLRAEDADVGQTHTYTVDDDRFEMDGSTLKLRDDQAVNYEQEQEIIVNVTADDGNGSTFTQEITVHVVDIIEQPQELTLTGDFVLELEPGYEVGAVNVDGQPPSDRFQLTVDDSRFEIVGSTLKLKDGQIVERATQEQIQLEISVTDQLDEFDPLSETFVLAVSENFTPFHNDDNPYDVDGSGFVTSLDALLVINYINLNGQGPIGNPAPSYQLDVNNDGRVSALDALLILNERRRLRATEDTVGRGEGEVPETLPDQGSPTPPSSGRAGEGEAARTPQAGLTETADRRSFSPSGHSASASQPIEAEAPSPESESNDDFASAVDRTLRLLSDESS